MTKRIIALVLVCILAIPIMVVPASATTLEDIYNNQDYWFNQLGGWLGTMGSDFNYWFQTIRNEIVDVYNLMLEQHDSLGEWLGTLGADILDSLSYESTQISDLHTALKDWFDYLYITMTTQYGYMIDAFQYEFDQFRINLNNHMDYLNNRLNTLFSALHDHITFWFGKLEAWFTNQTSSIVNAIDRLLNADSGAADDFQNQTSTDATEFDENMDIIQDVTRPTIEDIELDVDKEIPDGEITKVGELLGIFLKNQYIYIVFFVAFTFSLVSYGIFGKR